MMILYRIYTEDRDRDRIEGLCAAEFDGFTVLAGTGYWGGDQESCLIIEVISDDSAREDIMRIAGWIKKQNKQEAVFITEQVVAGEKI